jgi:4-hydroxy-tetrahydrodipicolinate synthase
MFRGVVVPMITPFTRDGAIDEPAVKRVVDHLIAGGAAGVFPLGTTGESASMPWEQKRRLVEATVKYVADRATVYAGVSSNCLRDSIDMASEFKQLDAQAVVAHMPSYYALNDAEIEWYFVKLADSVPLPLVLYNIPATTHHSIAIDSVVRLMEHPNIAALKDSSGDRPRLTELLKQTGGRDGFPILLGSSPCYSHGLRCGAVGLVPSGAHLVPEKYQAMYEAAISDRWDDVERLQRETDEVCSRYLKGLSMGQGLAVLKALLEARGVCGRTMLPPLREHVGPV